jgi:hypothetical protein
MPGVFFPVCSLPRLTAQARAANEWTPRYLRRLPVRPAPACPAWTIRRCRDRTRRYQPAQLIGCHALVARPEDAGSGTLLIINRASVCRLPRLLRPVTPAGSRPPFGVGQNPYLDHYSRAFASSRVLYRHRPSPPLRSGDSRDFCFAPPRRASPAYHVSPFVQTGGRVSLCTRGDHTCVGGPSRSPELAPRPVLGLEPLSRLSSAVFTMRNV